MGGCVLGLVLVVVAWYGAAGGSGSVPPAVAEAELVEQRRLVGLVAPAIRAALAGAALPPELDAAAQEDVRALLVAHDTTGAEVERVTAFRPEPPEWARVDSAWTQGDPRSRATWAAPLRGELTVRERGDPRPLTFRYLGGEAALEVWLAREGGRWRVLAVGGNLR